ncbi:MAG: putative sulfate/molybdate transporter, partial [Methanolinea sp.]|nr:putative sulfate/molybdate transporter [Methanolinea sp.]
MRKDLLSGMKFGLPELAGSVGDFGTILPLILAVSLAAGLNIGYIFLFFGLWFIITGFLYKLPIPIEPMKAIAVIALAENLSAGQIAAAGLILGILFLALGSGRWLDLLEKWIPTSVIRGIQLGLALLLLRTSGTFFLGDPIVFVGALGFMVAAWLIARFFRLPDLSAILLVVLAFGLGILMHGIPPFTLLPFPSLFIPSLADLPGAAADLVVPQALLTITNAILATSLLTRDLFSRDVPPARLSRTIGLMNLTSVPFGGFPMCHG